MDTGSQDRQATEPFRCGVPGGVIC